MQTNREPQTITMTPEQVAQDPIKMSDNHILQQVAAIRGNGAPVQAQQVPAQTFQPPALQAQQPPVTQAQPTDSRTTVAEDPIDLADPTITQDLGLEDPGSLADPTQETPTTDFQMEAFEKAFQAKYGIALEEAIASVQDVQQFRIKQTVKEQETQLAQEWGVEPTEAQARLQAVRDRFAKFDEAKQAKLSENPLQSAQLIWQQLEREQTARQTPNFDRSRGAYVPSGPVTFTAAQLAAMPEAEYAERQAEIIEAYRSGRVTY